MWDSNLLQIGFKPIALPNELTYSGHDAGLEPAKPDLESGALPTKLINSHLFSGIRSNQGWAHQLGRQNLNYKKTSTSIPDNIVLQTSLVVYSRKFRLLQQLQFGQNSVE